MFIFDTINQHPNTFKPMKYFKLDSPSTFIRIKDSFFIVSFNGSEYITTPDMVEISKAEFNKMTNDQDTHACW